MMVEVILPTLRIMDDLLPGDQAHSKKPLMESNHSDSLRSSSSVPSSNINCEGNNDLSFLTFPKEYNGLVYTHHIYMYVDIELEYYDARKPTKIIYSWEDAIDKIDFRNTSKEDVSK